MLIRTKVAKKSTYYNCGISHCWWFVHPF